MADLEPEDLPAGLRSRLGSDDEAQAAIDAALAGARRYCGWHVSPVRTETVTVDGPGGRVLSLPTRKLVNLLSVVEAGVSLDVSRLDWSRPWGTVEKYPCGSWTSRYGAITAQIEHGYTEAEAADWRAAIISMVGMDADASESERDDPALVRKKVDDTELQWSESAISADDRLSTLFAQFRILPE